MGTNLNPASIIASSEEVQLTTRNFLRYTSYSLLTFQAYEWLSNLPFEVTHIWRSPTLVKSQYLYARYMGIAAQIVQALVTEWVYLNPRPTSLRTCFYWHTGRVFSGQTLLLAYEIVTMSSVFAIYDRDMAILKWMIGVIAVEHILTYAIYFTYLNTVEVFGQCRVSEIPAYVAAIPLLPMFAHGFVWFLAWRKNKLRRLPIVRLITREGLKGLSILVVMESVIIGHGALGSLNVITTDVPDALYPIVILVFSSVVCRTIQNMHSASGGHTEEEDCESSENSVELRPLGGASTDSYAYAPLPDHDSSSPNPEPSPANERPGTIT